MSYLFCYRSGHLEIADAVPDGALQIAEATREHLERAIACARLGYDGNTWFVPGIPEAQSDQEALLLLRKFRYQVERRIPASAR